MRISDWSSDVCSSDLCRTCDSNSGKLPPKVSLKAGVAKAHATTSAQPDNLRLMTASPEDVGSTRPASPHQIGRAAWRERVCQRVDLGGRRVTNKKTRTTKKRRRKTAK